jgi:hypothetical protein
MLDQAALPWFAELNRSLNDELDDQAFRARIRASTGQLSALATEVMAKACAEHPGLDSQALRKLLPVVQDAVQPESMLLESVIGAA